MQGFQDYFSGRGTREGGEGAVPSAEELFAYFGMREMLHPTSAEYESDEKKAMGFLKKMCKACFEGREGHDFTDSVREFINSSALYGMKVDAGEKTADEARGVEKADTDTVKLMTLHASKGLEFDTVFLTGLNQGLIPLRCRNFEQEEEERRLFFVGITRARNELELSWYTNPGEPGVLGEPSRYLQMIPEHLLKRDDVRTEEEKRDNLQQMRREVQAQIRKKRAETVPESLRRGGEALS